MAISKTGKTSILFVVPNTKVNVKCYGNVLLKKMIPEVNRFVKHNEYLLMQDGAKAHTAKLTPEMLKDKKQFRLLEPYQWPRNSSDLNPVDSCGFGHIC